MLGWQMMRCPGYGEAVELREGIAGKTNEGVVHADLVVLIAAVIKSCTRTVMPSTSSQSTVRDSGGPPGAPGSGVTIEPLSSACST